MEDMEFEMDENGIVKFCSLTGFAMAPVAGMACLLRLEFRKSAEQVESEAIQIVMSPKQATALCESMLKMVSHIDMSVPPDAKRS